MYVCTLELFIKYNKGLRMNNGMLLVANMSMINLQHTALRLAELVELCDTKCRYSAKDLKKAVLNNSKYFAQVRSYDKLVPLAPINKLKSSFGDTKQAISEFEITTKDLENRDGIIYNVKVANDLILTIENIINQDSNYILSK